MIYANCTHDHQDLGCNNNKRQRSIFIHTQSITPISFVIFLILLFINTITITTVHCTYINSNYINNNNNNDLSLYNINHNQNNNILKYTTTTNNNLKLNTECTEFEQPIVDDFGFYKLANRLETSWIVQASSPIMKKALFVLCTDDQCGSPKYTLQGDYYAEINYSPLLLNVFQRMTLTQEIILDPLPDVSQTYYLQFSLSTCSFPDTLQADFTVFWDETTQVFITDGTMLNGGFQSVDLLSIIDRSRLDGSPKNITFQSQFMTRDEYDKRAVSCGYKLSAISIKRGPVSSASLITRDVYVSLQNGSDRRGNGTADNPFSTIAMALMWIRPNFTIWLNDGVYCQYAMTTTISQTQTLQSVSGNPQATILNGESRSSVIKLGSDTGFTFQIVGIGITSGYSSSNSPGGAAIFMEGQVETIINNCIFDNNHDSSDRGSIGVHGAAQLQLINSIIINSSISSNGVQYGPAVSALGFNDQSLSPVVLISGCTFLGNQHSVSADQADSIIISNSTFNGTNTKTPQLCSIMISRSPLSLIENSLVSNNGNGALCIIKSTCDIYNCTLTNNSMPDGPGANVYISQQSVVNLYNTYLIYSESTSGAGLFLMESSRVSTFGCVFENINSQDGAIISISDSNLLLDTTIISNCKGTYMIYQFFGNLDIFNSTFSNSTGGIWAANSIISVILSQFYRISTDSKVMAASPDVDVNKFQECRVSFETTSFVEIKGTTNLIDSRLEMSWCQVNHSQTSFLYIHALSNAIIFGSTFSYNTDSIIIQQAGSTLFANQTIFSNNRGVRGSVLYQLENCDQSLIVNCTFEENNANYGGSIYTSSKSTLVLQDIIGRNNIAISGGFISTEKDVNLYINGSSLFENNYATMGGGVIYFQETQPDVDNSVQFIDNYAGYGPIQATPPTSLHLFDPSCIPTVITSAQTQVNCSILVNDYLGQTVVSTEWLFIKVYMRLDGNTIDLMPVELGVARFTNVLLSGYVGNRVKISFVSNDPTLAQYDLPFTPLIQSCPNGTTPTLAKTQCSPCSPGTYGYDGEACIECPTKAYCNGGTDVQSKQGYWYDENQYPRVLYECPNSNCLGNNTCANFTEGLMCSSCTPGYYNWGGSCVACERVNGLFIFVIPLFIVLMILWVQRSDTESGMMTVIIYFVQTFLVISSGISFYILALINLQLDSGAAGGGGNGAVILSKFCPGPFDFYDRHYITIVSAPLLIWVLFASTAVTVILSKCCHARRNRNYKPLKEKNEDEDDQQLERENMEKEREREEAEKEKSTATSETLETPLLGAEEKGGLPKEVHIKSTYMSKQFGSFIKLLLNIYSPIATSAFTMFFCETVGTYPPVLVTNPSVTCQGDQYHKALIVSYTLFTVIIGVPIVIFILLFRNRNRMHEPRVVRIYGVFFLKYKEQFYFWDVILLIRRLGIVLMSMMPSTSSTRSVLLVTVTLISVLLQIQFKPFKNPQDNQLEFSSLTLLFICAVFLDNPIYQSFEQWVVIISGSIFAIHVAIIIYLHYRATIVDHALHYLHIISRKRFGRPMSYNQNDGAPNFTIEKPEKKPLISLNMNSGGYGTWGKDEEDYNEEENAFDSDNGEPGDQFDSLLYIK